MGKDYNGKEIKTTGFSNGKGAKIDVYSPSGKAKNHDTIHISVNTDNKSYKATTKFDGKKETSSGSCYLTTACMKHLKDDFNDKCYELLVLRWFRDNFVSQEDIDHYYQTTPVIVDAINRQENCDEIYEIIYQRVINTCVNAIMSDDYEFAYIRYKESILQLEELYAREELQQRLIRAIS